MRSDTGLSDEISQSTNWKNQPRRGRLYEMYERRPGGEVVGHSQSGHERNHLFINDRQGRFIDQSIFSGTDSIYDGRTNVVWDFDGDGWQDLAVVNANYPHLQIFRNQMSQAADVASHRFVAVRLVGGNDTASASDQWSNRDAAGAMIRVSSAGLPQIIRQIHLGEGFAAQNSATKLIGIGNQSSADIEITWPSGNITRQDNIPTGSLVLGYENAEHAGGTHFVLSDYARNQSSIPPPEPASSMFTLGTLPATDKPLRLYISVATWCAACKSAHPQIRTLYELLGDQIEIFGFPADANDSKEKLNRYMLDFSPAFSLLDQVATEDRSHFRNLVVNTGNSAALPSSILTDARGRVLFCGPGVPTVSEIRNAIRQESHQ